MRGMKRGWSWGRGRGPRTEVEGERNEMWGRGRGSGMEVEGERNEMWGGGREGNGGRE